MFLRRYRRTKNGKTHIYYALVESVRTEAGPRQRVVAHLGELNHEQERRWQRTVRFHNQQGEDQQLRLFPDDLPVSSPDDPDLVRINLKSVGWTNPRRFGDIWLGLWLWKRLKLDEILDRHVPQGKETIRPADMVAIEVINRLCSPRTEFALAEHWYASTGLEDLLGIPDSAVTKDRLYRTLDQLLRAQTAIECDLEKQLGTLFRLDYSLVLYDLTSTYFEGLAAENELAQRGYSRDHRSDCKQIVVALVVTKDGFPLAHRTFAGNTRDLKTVQTIVGEIETQFGTSQRIWVMDRGMISDESLKFLGESNRRYLLATKRGELAEFQAELGKTGWDLLPKNPQVQVKLFERESVHYLLARSRPRRRKERAIRRRQRRGLATDLNKLSALIDAGKLKKRDKILERVGRLQERYPKARGFVQISVTATKQPRLEWRWDQAKYRRALAADGAYLLRSNQPGWTAAEFWETYIQLTIVERAFRVLKSELLLRPIWHHYSGRTRAHVFVCVLAYALWKTLDYLAKRAGLMTEIRKPDIRRPRSSPKARRMTPRVILRELRKIKIGDILLSTSDGRQLALRRVARPRPDQARILDALKLVLPERLASSDRIL
jgi:transposase